MSIRYVNEGTLFKVFYSIAQYLLVVFRARFLWDMRYELMESLSYPCLKMEFTLTTRLNVALYSGIHANTVWINIENRELGEITDKYTLAMIVVITILLYLEYICIEMINNTHLFSNLHEQKRQCTEMLC